MIDGSKKRNRQLAFELQNSHVFEKRSNLPSKLLSPQLSRRKACRQVTPQAAQAHVT